jgi:hypothetical protein
VARVAEHGIRRTDALPHPRATIVRGYGLMAEALRFETNDEALATAADASFGRFPIPLDDRDPLVLRLFSEPAPSGAPTLGPVAVRTAGDLYFISAGSRDLGVADIDAGVAHGFVSEVTARDAPAVRHAFIESLALSMLPRGRGYLVLHAAGVVRGDRGLVLQGPAGAGKSTLAMACARRGFGVFAEDAVFVHIRSAGLEWWGMPWVQRLLPDARALFPEIAGLPDHVRPNGESKIEVELDIVHPGRTVPCVAPGPIVLLSRGDGGATRIEAVKGAGLADALEVHWPWDGGWSDEHEAGARSLGDHGVFRLHVNGPPDEAVDALEALMDSLPASIPTR